MAKLISDMVLEAFYETPKRPRSDVFVCQHILDRHELESLRRIPDYAKALKRRMAHSLANHIVDECQLFQLPGMGDLYDGVPIRMEMTINDRGAYENFVPLAKAEGRKEGVKVGGELVKRSLPYGFEPEQYYE